MTEQEYVCLFLRKYGIIYKYYEMKMRDFMRIELEDENKKKTAGGTYLSAAESET